MVLYLGLFLFFVPTIFPQSLIGSHVALMINNLGGTSVLELNIIAGSVIKQLGKSEKCFLNE